MSLEQINLGCHCYKDDLHVSKKKLKPLPLHYKSSQILSLLAWLGWVYCGRIWPTRAGRYGCTQVDPTMGGQTCAKFSWCRLRFGHGQLGLAWGGGGIWVILIIRCPLRSYKQTAQIDFGVGNFPTIGGENLYFFFTCR